MDSRQRIVESAKRLFWQNGYSSTSPRQVMEDSGVGQGSFYHHFPAKSDLGREVIDANGRDVLQTLRAAMEGKPTGRDRVVAFLNSATEAVQGCRIGVFAYDVGIALEPDLHGRLAASFTALTDLLEETVREGQSDGSLPSSLDPRQTAASLWALLQGAYLAARATGRQSFADDAVAGALALLITP